MTIDTAPNDAPLVDAEDALLVDGPEPTDAARAIADVKTKLEQPEHEGDALGDFGETVIDDDGEVKPELLDEPEKA